MPAISRARTVRSDAVNGDPSIAEAQERFEEALTALWLSQDARAIAQTQAIRVNGWAGRNLARALSITPEDLPRAPLSEQWLATQRRLLNDLRSEYVQRVNDVLVSAPFGIRAEELTKELRKSLGFGRSRARLIAVNETLTLAAEVNKSRQQSLGITKYQWSTSADERVRSNHAFLHDQIFDWSNPPVGGGTSEAERGHPGSGIRCRCVAVPVTE